MPLVLFDIDGTLLRALGLGVRAMEAAGRSLFGEGFSLRGVEIAGCIDPRIWRDAARQSGIADTGAEHERFRRAYADTLAGMIDAGEAVEALPGAVDLVEALRERPDVGLGVLTGNYPETGRLKLEAAGFDLAHFQVNAWGSDGTDRRDLPPVAIRRHQERSGTSVAAHEVVIIGDTPHDVDCARANGCRAVAVATGVRMDRADLAAHEPDLLLDDLTDAASIIAWIEAETAVR